MFKVGDTVRLILTTGTNKPMKIGDIGTVVSSTSTQREDGVNLIHFWRVNEARWVANFKLEKVNEDR